MSQTGAQSGAELMDRIYRHQRHVYDLTRKYYLLGRDRLINELQPPKGGVVLELGCGTGRNLIAAARRYPDASFVGIDISNEMLETARSSIERARLSGRVRVAQGDATGCDLDALFGRSRFDRVFLSYTLSIIPPWREVVGFALTCIGPGGSLHVVDFGQQERLPGWFQRGLSHWLGKFHVHPPADMLDAIEAAGQAVGARVETTTLYRDYARAARVSLPKADGDRSVV